MASVQDRLLARLRAELGPELVPEGTRLERTRASRSGRSEGAWSWLAMNALGLELYIGSQYPMGKLLQCQNWRIGRSNGQQPPDYSHDTEVEPCMTCRRSDTWVCSPSRGARKR